MKYIYKQFNSNKEIENFFSEINKHIYISKLKIGTIMMDYICMVVFIIKKKKDISIIIYSALVKL